MPRACFVLLSHAHALARALHTRTRTQARDRGPDVQQLLKALMTRVDNYIWSETKFQEWVYEKRDAQVLRRGWWSAGRGQDEDGVRVRACSECLHQCFGDGRNKGGCWLVCVTVVRLAGWGHFQ